MKMDMLEFEGELKLTPTYNTIIMPLPSLRLIKKPGDETEDILDGRIFVVITGACNEFGRQFAMEIARILEQGSKVLLLDNDEVILYNTTMWMKKYVPADYHLVDFTIDQPQVIQEMLASYIYPKENCPSWEEIRKNHPMPPDYDRIIVIHNTTPLDDELTREDTSEVYWAKFYNLTVRAPLALNTAVRHIFNLTTDGEEAVDAIEDEKEFDVMIKKSVEAIIRSRENKEEELKVNVENEGENKAKKEEKGEEKKIDVEDKKLKEDKDDEGEKKLKGDKDDDKKMDDEKKKKDEDKKMEDEKKKKDDKKNVQCRDNKENTSFFLNQCKSQKKNDNLKRTISEASCSGNSQVKSIPEKRMKLIETGEVSGTQTETKEKNTDEKMDDMEIESEESNVKNNETEKKLESNDDDDEKKEEEKCEEGDVKVEEKHNVKTESGEENDGKERDDGDNVEGVKTKIKQKTVAIFVNIIPVCQSVAFNNMESYCTSYVVRKMVFQKGPGMQSPKARVLNYAPGCITFPDSLFAPGEEKKGPLELKRLKPPEPQPDLNDENRRPTIVESVTELISILQENTYASGDIIDYNTNNADPVFENIEEMSIKILGEMDTS